MYPRRQSSSSIIQERESVYISLTIQNRNTWNNPTLNLGIQPTGRNHFHTVHTSGPQKMEEFITHFSSRVYWGEKSVQFSTRDFNHTRPPTEILRWNINALVTNPAVGGGWPNQGCPKASQLSRCYTWEFCPLLLTLSDFGEHQLLSPRPSSMWP